MIAILFDVPDPTVTSPKSTLVGLTTGAAFFEVGDEKAAASEPQPEVPTLIARQHEAIMATAMPPRTPGFAWSAVRRSGFSNSVGRELRYLNIGTTCDENLCEVSKSADAENPAYLAAGEMKRSCTNDCQQNRAFDSEGTGDYGA